MLRLGFEEMGRGTALTRAATRSAILLVYSGKRKAATWQENQGNSVGFSITRRETLGDRGQGLFSVAAEKGPCQTQLRKGPESEPGTTRSEEQLCQEDTLVFYVFSLNRVPLEETEEER